MSARMMLPTMPTIRIPRNAPLTHEEEMLKNRVIVIMYLILHVLLPILPLPLMIALGWCLIVADVFVGYKVSREIDSRIREGSYLRNLRLLNPFHYQPQAEEHLVNAFIAIIAPETTREIHEE